MGDRLERLAAEIPWELFRPMLETVHEKDRKPAAGHKPWNLVLLFKVLILQTLYNLADEAVECRIRDRLSFMRFLGLEMYDRVPDGTRVWRSRERLKALELIKPLFDRFGDHLTQAGPEARRGEIIDASIVPVPIQRNRRTENRRIKAGKVPEDWDEHNDQYLMRFLQLTTPGGGCARSGLKQADSVRTGA
jgi:IS5 family transposase